MIVVSRQTTIPLRTNVTVVLVTTTARGIPTEVTIDRSAQLRESSVANCDELYTIPKSSLSEKLGSLRFEDARAVDRALMISRDLL